MKKACRNCKGTNLVEIIDLGKMPIAYRLLESVDDEVSLYARVLHWCQSCGLGQIVDPIDPELLYMDYNYCFSSWKDEPHIPDEIRTIFRHMKVESCFDIGCNEGVFLDALKTHGVSVLFGLEPNRVTSQMARDRGFTVYTQLLSEEICKKAVKENGQFDLVVTRQVLEHLADLDLYFRCVDILLKPEGYLFIDVPNVSAGLKVGDCSILWEEHINYFTEDVLRMILEKNGYNPLELSHFNFSGGGMAVLSKRGPCRSEEHPVVIPREFLGFENKVRGYADRLRYTLAEVREKGYLVVLYGIGNRGSTIVNGLKLSEFIDFAVDDQKERQGLFVPGSLLPIHPSTKIQNQNQPIVCLLAVNNENEDAVIKRLHAAPVNRFQCLSLLAPNDISAELEQFRTFMDKGFWG